MTGRQWASGSLIAIAVAVAARARGAECAPPPMALPGLSGPPAWFGTPGAADWRPQLDDPRWAGSAVRTFTVPSAVSPPDAEYRVVASGNLLHVSVQALAGATDAADAVFVGITKGTAGSSGTAATIAPDRAAPPVAGPAAGVPADSPLPAVTGTAGITWYDTADATVAAPLWAKHAGSQPAWLKDVATWNRTAGTLPVWAVTFKVDLGALGISGPLKLFLGMRIGVGGVVHIANSPLAATDPGSVAGETILPASSATWADLQAPGAPCPAGVSTSAAQVGVADGSVLGNQILACTDTSTDPRCPRANVFRVQVQNVPAPSGGERFNVRARIRIADWGSTIADPLAPWKLLPGETSTVLTDDGLTFPSCAGCACTSTGATSNAGWSYCLTGTSLNLDYTCTLQGTDRYCPVLPTGSDNHQCIVVELANGSIVQPVAVQTPAVYRNMDYTWLSTASVPATISLKGLQQVTGQARDRDVYLYVQTVNMPEHGSAPLWLPSRDMEAARRYAEGPPPRRPGRRETAAAGGQPPASAAGPASILDIPLLSPERALARSFPTYVVHAYFDTGRTTAAAAGRKILAPMVPFGFYFQHQGPLYGFTHLLEAMPGTVLTQLGPNLYLVHVANEGEARLKTTVTAEERPRPPRTGWCGCQSGADLGVLALGLALAAPAWRRRRARPPA